MEKIIAFVPAKGNSNRVPSKNLKLLDGKPLVQYTLEKLSSMDIIDEIYVDTESEEIATIASKIKNIKHMKRDPKLSSNLTDGNKLLLNEIEYDNSGTIYVQVLCTSPFLKKQSIEKAIEAVRDQGFSCSFAIRKEKQYLWNNSGSMYDLSKIPNSSELEETIVESMSLYVIRKQDALSNKSRICENFKFIEISPMEAIDLNNLEDFELAEFVASGKREDERKLLNNLKISLSSPILSDILDQIGVSRNLIIKKLNPNFENAKILGYAKTLKLRKIKEEENADGIYDALRSYDTITSGDVIVVETETPELAYFGELNANLAIRAGASGVIVGGATRDSHAVKRCGLPVFSTHNTCVDVRGRATLDSISMPVRIEEVEVCEGDLIFADSEGVVVIPSDKIEIVIQKAMQVMRSEKEIIHDITDGKQVDFITKKHGFF